MTGVGKRGTPAPWATPAALGAVCLAGGVGLYVTCVVIGLNKYDEQPYPWWLSSLSFLAIALALVGFGVVVISVIRGLRRLFGRHSRTLAQRSVPSMVAGTFAKVGRTDRSP